jgi:hypothetical protein
LIELEEIEKFLNYYVRIGVPHDVISNRLFFYFGFIKYVDSTELKLETKKGFRIIPLENVRDIQIMREAQNDF